MANVIILEAEDVTALVTAEITMESTIFKVPAVNVGATQDIAFLIVTVALELLTVTKLGLPSLIVTSPEPVILAAVPILQL